MAIQAGSVEVEFIANLDPLKQGIAEADQVVSKGAENISQSSSGLRKVFDGIGERAKQEFGDFEESATDALNKTVDSALDLQQTLSNIGASLKTIGFGALKAGATAATASLVKMAKAGVRDTSALENTQIQMIGLTHSIQAGNRAMAMAVQYYKDNPFNRFEVTDATKSLIQFGANLEEIPDLLDEMGKVSLSTGASISMLAYQYQRMISDGRINTLDLITLANQNVPIWNALAKQLNTTAGGVRELVAAGKLEIEDFKEAFKTLVDDQAMEQFQNTLARQVDRAKGRISDLRGAIAGYFTDTQKGIVILEGGIYRSWTNFLKTFANIMTNSGSNATPTGIAIVESIQKISVAIGGVIDKLTNLLEPALAMVAKLLTVVSDNAELMIPIIGAALLAFTQASSMLPGIGPIIQKVSGAFGALGVNLQDLIRKHWGLVAVVGILIKGFAEAYKTDEEFKKTIQDLLSAIGELGKSLSEIVKTILPTLLDAIKTLAQSGAVKGILQAIAGALSWVAQAIASIPPDNLAMIISFFASLKLLKTNPIMLAVGAIALLIGYIRQLAEAGENLPQKLLEVGHNMMVGLLNGIIEGSKKVIQFVKDLANNIVNTFKSILRIHSPSQEFYEMGEMVTLGFANGVEDSSNVVQVAMSNLAKDILALSNKVIKNKVDFGILDIKQEYQEWKKVSRLFTQGSEQYNQAIENMENARKSANLKILSLQRDYNDALDSTIDRIANMYGLFDEVSLGGGKNSNQILTSLDQQVAKMQEWAEAQEMIAGLNLDKTLKAELASMGVAQVGELETIANMTADELSNLNEMWVKKQNIANEAGIAQMADLKDQTLDQISELRKGIDDETIGITDVGGRLVENISEGIYGAMPTLESAYEQLNDYIAQAQKQLAGSTGGDTNSGDNEPNVPDAGGNALEEIQANIEQMGSKLKDMVPKALLGVVGAWGVSKFGPKLISLLWQKIFGSKADAATNIMDGLKAFLGAGKQGTMSKDTIAALTDVLFQNTEGKAKDFWATLTGKLGSDEFFEGDGSQQVAKVAKNLKQATSPAQTIATSSKQISGSIQETGKSFSKTSGVLDIIKQGAKTIIWIAGAIAAVAGAMWVTYNAMKDVDFLKLAEDLIAMGVAVVEFGALAFLADKFVSVKGILVIIGIAVDIAAVAVACKIAFEAMKDLDWDIFAKILGRMFEAIAIFGVGAGIFGMKPVALAEALGLLVIAGIALDIVALSKACKEAYDTMSGMDWEEWGNMLGAMINALGVIGGFQALLGIFAPLEFLGWGAVIAVCDSLVRISEAIVVVDQKVPEDFGSVEKKIQNIKRTLEIINGADLGTVIGMVVTSWETGPVERIMEMYVKVAEALNKLSNIDLDKEAIDANLDYIKETIASINARTGVISGWLEASALDVEASSVENAGRIVIVYGNMVDALNKLANFEPDQKAIGESLLAMVGVITLLRQQSYGVNGIFNIFTDMNVVANDVEKIKSIVQNFLEMVPTFQDLEKPENQISDTTKTSVVKNIQKIEQIVKEIGKVDTVGYIDTKENDIKKIQSILNNFVEMEPTMWQVSTFNMSYLDNAKNRIGDLRELVREIAKVDTVGWIDQKESDVQKIQSILNKFTELEPVFWQISQMNLGYVDGDNGAKKKIEILRDLIWEVGQINQSESDSLDNKINIIEKSKTIATKLAEFAELVKNLQATDNSSMIQMLTDNLYQLVSGVQNTLTEQAEGFENVGGQLGQALANGIKAVDFTEAGNSVQGSIWQAIENRIPDEYQQGVWLATQFANGVKSVDMSSVGQAIQSSIWWGVQNRISDEYYQGRTLGETFRQGIYDVDYANSGWWAVQGFVNGVYNRGYYSGGDSVYWVGYNLANDFLNGLKKRSGEGSPWKTTIESGSWAVEGLITGIRKSENALVEEATSLADEVVDALTMDDLTISPELNAHGTYTPTMATGDGYAYRNGGNVIIEQTNNVYSDVDMEVVNRNLAWDLAKV